MVENNLLSQFFEKFSLVLLCNLIPNDVKTRKFKAKMVIFNPLFLYTKIFRVIVIKIIELYYYLL